VTQQHLCDGVEKFVSSFQYRRVAPKPSHDALTLAVYSAYATTTSYGHMTADLCTLCTESLLSNLRTVLDHESRPEIQIKRIDRSREN
jgi:hypothetical protein